MQHLKIFIELTRLNKPIGFMLLFWPCSWGLAFAYNESQNLNLFLYYLVLFLTGSVLMRSAGCIFNDIVDKDFDKRVKRTRSRPIASGKISVQQSLIYVLLLCGIAFLILIQFNFFTILLGLASMIFAFSYPYMKRITYWPQLFLGFTFNWGLVMAWFSVTNETNYTIFILYLAAIFWTLGYDTIYGAQDMSDDEIIGLKSTSIKFKGNIKLFVFISYLIVSLLVFFSFRGYIGVNIFTLLLFFFKLTLLFQVIKFDEQNPKVCLKMFKFNNYSGLILFLCILTINL